MAGIRRQFTRYRRGDPGPPPILAPCWLDIYNRAIGPLTGRGLVRSTSGQIDCPRNADLHLQDILQDRTDSRLYQVVQFVDRPGGTQRRALVAEIFRPIPDDFDCGTVERFWTDLGLGLWGIDSGQAELTIRGSGLVAVSPPFAIPFLYQTVAGDFDVFAQLKITSADTTPRALLIKASALDDAALAVVGIERDSALRVIHEQVAPGAATRLYFSFSQAAPVNPAFGAWDDLGDSTRMALLNGKTAEPLALHGLSLATGLSLNAQFVSAPLAAQSIGGAAKAYLRAYNDTHLGAATSRLLIKVVNNDGTLVRGTLLPLAGYGPGTAFPSAGLVNRIWVDGDALTPVVAHAGDRLVIEVGYADASPDDGFLQFGAAAAVDDLPENETETSALTPWIEFSQRIRFQQVGGVLPPAGGNVFVRLRRVGCRISGWFSNATVLPIKESDWTEIKEANLWLTAEDVRLGLAAYAEAALLLPDLRVVQFRNWTPGQQII